MITRKILKWIGALVGLLLLLSIGVRIYFTPSYHGKERISALEEEATIVFDGHGVPHIYASNAVDAYRALGWVHAKERLFQMDLLRRAASGRLSGAFGEDFVTADKFMLNLGISENSQKSLEALKGDEAWLSLARAYLEGVNTFIEEENAPLEYVLTGLKREPFELIDVYNSIGYMAFNFAHAPGIDPFLTHVRDSLGQAYVEDLSVEVDTSSVRIPSYPSGIKDLSSVDLPFRVLDQAIGRVPSVPFLGSNSWVIGPSRTRNGAVILANDPHMKFAQPAVWYESHISYPGFESYGFYLAGIPFALLHHNRVKANGLTMFVNDDFDFYRIEIPSDLKDTYRVGEEARKWEKVRYTIGVKGGEPVDFELRRTHLGPVIDAEIDSAFRQPLAMHWVFTDRLNELPSVLYRLNYSRDLKDFRDALRNLHAPGLNIMYGDSSGNYAWFASAQLHRLNDSVSPKFVLDTHSRIRHGGNILDFDFNPQSINPPVGYVYSANNAPASDSLYIPGYYLPEDRARRITEILESDTYWDLAKTEEMMLDAVNSGDAEICQLLIDQLDTGVLTEEQSQWLRRLKTWDGSYSRQQTVPGFYHNWIYRIVCNAFEDELGGERLEGFLGTHLFKRSLRPLIEDETSTWWDRKGTAGKETQGQIVTLSFQQAWDFMEEHHGRRPERWTWGSMHSLTHRHALGAVPVLGKLWNVGPDPVEGSREVINNLMFSYRGEPGFDVHSGPSTRRIVDFSNIHLSRAVLPTGQSGNLFSPFYDDQRELYVNGEYRLMLIDSVAIRKNRKGLIRLIPADRKD